MMDFPFLSKDPSAKPYLYLDTAATSQKPQVVLDRMMAYYVHENANVHRGVYQRAQVATQAYEGVRQQVADFIKSPSSRDIIFTSGTTAGLNFLAQSLLKPRLKAGDIILTTPLEHHSNLVPWQVLAQEKGAKLEYLPLTEDFQVDLSALDQVQGTNVKALVIHHISNVLGVQQPIQQLAQWVHEKGGLIIVDGAQAVAHHPVDVAKLGVDAYCFSGHKMYGPTGVGVTYLKADHHETCLPFFYGGEMINRVGLDQSDYKESPWKFEGGTPPIAQVVGLGAAIDFLKAHEPMERETYIQGLSQALAGGLKDLKGVTVYGAGAGIVSFNIDGVHPHDATSAYDLEGIAIRAGHHCAQPLMRYLGVGATLRASFGLYNQRADIDRFLEVTMKVRDFFHEFE